ncbi:histidine ammonia-lyase [Halovenus aranensis]|jgi:histidine ammonia-lyase|uniref:Histidine ammonia-lyase n=1 Tax=Halovenus aranensis TaxID=890420 RepID=A0A1G8S9A8_9EURY|nr:histidine ammonia-lyase [Halovenus aranensis]SDJ25757.1 histidine ammonia-lyase [Halovenus aranensis]
MTVQVGTELTPEDVAAVAREEATVEIPETVRERVRASRERVSSVVEQDDAVYGINTGFGELVTERIPRDDLADLQHNLVRSHASGQGEELGREEVRALLVTRLHALALGYSGVRESVVDTLAAMVNRGVHPVVRTHGSLGASGDLAPLAHLALVLIGEGEATVDGERLAGEAALRAAEREPLSLAPKEGLALINGTQLTAGLAALAVVDAEGLLDVADAAGALTTEVGMGTTVTSSEAIAGVRPHEGHGVSAANVRRLTADSEIVESHRNCDRVQDAYSLRCLPQVHGAVRDAVAHLREAVETELNSATDNPLIFDADTVESRASQTESAAVVSGGNFHGAPLAHRLDYAANAVTDLAAMSERRVDRLLNPNVQESHLSPFLAGESGVESGLMIAQYTAASLVSDCRAHGSPGVDNVPVSGGQEDHVSMSATSAVHARQVLEQARRVVAIELLCSAEAAEYVDDSLAHGVGTAALYDGVRDVVDPLDGDRSLDGDIDAIAARIRSGDLRDRVAATLDDGFAD